MKRVPHKRSFLEDSLEEEDNDQTYSVNIDAIQNPALVTTITGKFRWRHFPKKPGDERVFNTREEALRNRP